MPEPQEAAAAALVWGGVAAGEGLAWGGAAAAQGAAWGETVVAGAVAWGGEAAAGAVAWDWAVAAGDGEAVGDWGGGVEAADCSMGQRKHSMSRVRALLSCLRLVSAGNASKITAGDYQRWRSMQAGRHARMPAPGGRGRRAVAGWWRRGKGLHVLAVLRHIYIEPPGYAEASQGVSPLAVSWANCAAVTLLV